MPTRRTGATSPGGRGRIEGGCHSYFGDYGLCLRRTARRNSAHGRRPRADGRRLGVRAWRESTACAGYVEGDAVARRRRQNRALPKTAVAHGVADFEGRARATRLQQAVLVAIESRFGDERIGKRVVMSRAGFTPRMKRRRQGACRQPRASAQVSASVSCAREGDAVSQAALFFHGFHRLRLARGQNASSIPHTKTWRNSRPFGGVDRHEFDLVVARARVEVAEQRHVREVLVERGSPQVVSYSRRSTGAARRGCRAALAAFGAQGAP